MRYYLLCLWLAGSALLGSSSFAASAESVPVNLPSKDKLRIYLLMGQSNMAGTSPIEDEDRKPHERVLRLSTKGQWERAGEPIHPRAKGKGGMGPAFAFAKAMADADPNVTIGLVPCAVGGTPLKRWERGGDLYSNAVFRARAAVKSGTLAGVLWHQGEADAKTEEETATYQKRLVKMIQDLREDLGAPGLPFVAGQIGQFLSEPVGDRPVRPLAKSINQQLAGLPKLLPGVACVSAAGLDHKGDGVHFSTAAQRELGKRYAAAMTDLQKPGSAKEGARPNILFCLADDWGYTEQDPSVLPVPAFDRVAREGVLFKNAFVAAPSCTPSRAVMLTGQWHWRLEQGANLHFTLPAKFPVYPDLLEAAGYHVGYTRKGWGPGNDTAGGRTRNPAGPRYDDFAAFLSKRAQGQPFCFWFGSHEPHRPYERGSGVKHGLKPEAVKVPPYLPDNDIVRRDITDFCQEVRQFDADVASLIQQLEKTGELENTIVVISGDNGWPLPRGKATIYDAGTHVPLAIRWGAKVKAGRVVDDFVSLGDLAPTFLEAAGLKPPREMTARSLIPILFSSSQGQVNAARDYVLTGMETHTQSREEPGFSRGTGYPMRALRTKDYLFILNFKPNRWPSGDPNGFENSVKAAAESEQALMKDTFTAFADVDASPTKAFMLLHKDDPAVKPLFNLAFGKRPGRELYDLRKDPFELKNVAEDSAYAQTVKDLEQRLLRELRETGDPRVIGGGDAFDKYPRPPGAGGAGKKRK